LWIDSKGKRKTFRAVIPITCIGMPEFGPPDEMMPPPAAPPSEAPDDEAGIQQL